ncbi:unnamed protein product, partial [Ceratitis capitata]
MQQIGSKQYPTKGNEKPKQSVLHKEGPIFPKILEATYDFAQFAHVCKNFLSACAALVLDMPARVWLSTESSNSTGEKITPANWSGTH